MHYYSKFPNPLGCMHKNRENKFYQTNRIKVTVDFMTTNVVRWDKRQKDRSERTEWGYAMKKSRRLYIRLWVLLRLLRLRFVRVERPADAKTPEQMLEEIRKRSELT